MPSTGGEGVSRLYGGTGAVPFGSGVREEKAGTKGEDNENGDPERPGCNWVRDLWRR